MGEAAVDAEDFERINGDENSSRLYHATKLHFLIQDIRDKGIEYGPQGVLYWPPTADADEIRYFVHPGTGRYSAIKYLQKWETECLVWDAYDVCYVYTVYSMNNVSIYVMRIMYIMYILYIVCIMYIFMI